MNHEHDEENAAREPGYTHAVTFRGADAERRAERAYKDIRDELRRAQGERRREASALGPWVERRDPRY